ncbi:GtrA family protein [Nocardia uniformis]|uniref:GtrA family protein n=1 Tax=Nocardia uniformis TaxID=53432 RepID=A0A849CGN1_9NOCA|nr:GtrA family protein [Nocardia uniformis]NNH72641.1 GtrA family protein [Nocardia uniformis]
MTDENDSRAQAASLPAVSVLTLDTEGYRMTRRAWNRWIRQGEVFLRGERALAQLIRFALVGGLSNIGYLVPFLALYSGGPQFANLAGSLVSATLANELHRRLTFRASGRVRWYTAQIEGGALALTGLAVTSGAIAVLERTAPSMDGPAHAAALLAISAAVGVFRFLTLRRWVF